MPVEVLNKLSDWFADCPGALVAFSGGVDSSLVAFLARHFLGEGSALAVVSASPSLKLSDLDEAKAFAVSQNISLRVIATKEMENPDYFTNPSNRCYFCKHTLYEELESLSDDYPDWWILNGTNRDDLGDYRPGLKAADEFKVRSPLSEVGIDKAAVRELANYFNLDCWDKPASPCLASRVPYGEEITLTKLRQIEAAEAIVQRVGFKINRVRHFGEIARVEIPSEDINRLEPIKASIRREIQMLGFAQVEFDAEGFVSGKLNRALRHV